MYFKHKVNSISEKGFVQLYQRNSHPLTYKPMRLKWIQVSAQLSKYVHHINRLTLLNGRIVVTKSLLTDSPTREWRSNVHAAIAVELFWCVKIRASYEPADYVEWAHSGDQEFVDWQPNPRMT